MKLLIDTNVLCEAMARRPRPEVVAWLDAQPAEAVFLSVLSIGEVDFGIASLADGAKRSGLLAWRNGVVARVGERLLPVDSEVAAAWGGVRARARAAKRTMPQIDALLAATAQVHGLTVVTRNWRDFQGWGGPIHNPWGER